MFISEYKTDHPVGLMCRVLEVSRSGYYAWSRRKPGVREQANRELLERIRASHRQSHETYGSPRIVRDLRAEGICCGKNRVAQLMRRHGIVARAKRRFKVTTRRKTGSQYAPDRLQRNFVAERPHQVWTTDITYIWTFQGWLYLAVILDLCSRAIVGWATSARINADLVCRAVSIALERRRPTGELTLHSDRGSQYVNQAIDELIASTNVHIVKSHCQSCYDNAVTESFFHTLKTEWVSFETYYTRDQAHRSLFEYIELFYNRQRRHSSLGYRTPVEVENLFLIP